MAYLNAMNATPYHPKVKITLAIPDREFVAGQEVRGKIDLESRADKGLGINIISAELFGVQELTSRDHSATSTFLHTRRLFQGPGLPISNAVLPQPPPDAPTLPRGYRSARKGLTSFFFAFTLPFSSPSSINFGSGVARIRYEVTAQVEVFWKGEKKIVTDVKPVNVVESPQSELKEGLPTSVVGEGGKIQMHGRVIGGYLIPGQSACVELFLKNHSVRKTSGVSVSLTQRLKLRHPLPQKHPFKISDTLLTVPYRGDEYCVPPGGEGVANLVFEVPPYATGVHGEKRHSGEEDGYRASEALFSVECEIVVSVGIGIGAKDIVMTIPTTIVHPEALPMELIQNYNPYSYAPEPAMPHPYAESYQLEPPRLQFVAQQYSAPPSPLFTPYAPSPVQPYPSPYASSPVQANPYFAHHASLPNTPQFVPHAALPNVPVNPAYRATPPNEYVNDHRAPLPAPVHNGAQVWLPPVSHPIAPPIVPVRPSSAGDIPQAPPSLPVAHAVYHPEQTQLHAIPNEAPKEEPRQIVFPSMAEPTSQVVSPISRPLPIPAALSSPNIQQPQPLPPPAPGARLEDRVPPPPNPPSAPIAPPDTQSLSPPSNALGLPTLDIATALTQPAGVLSPRPRISPRMSFSNTESDRNVKVASMKSAPVEELERMAEQVRLEEEKERAAGTVGVINGEMSVAKTLPGPPVPSGKVVDVVKPTIPKVSEIFSFHAIPAGPKKPQGQGSESGLDALERRLSKAAAAERWLSAAPNPTLKHSVGGHKKIPSGPRQDTQTRSRESSRQRRAGKEGGLPPMPMPRSVTPEVQRVQEPLLVPLPVTSTSRSPSGSRERGRSPRGESVLNGPRSPARSPAKPEAAPSREAEMYLLRAQAVGRVGSWLDEVDHSDTGVHHVPWATLSGQAIPKTSSGFRSTKKAPTPSHATNLQLLFSEKPAEDQIIQPLYSEEPPLIPVTKPPPPTLQEAAATAQIPMLKSKYASPLLTPFPPPQLEKKYDVRSARGGRGGVVTALTSVWGNDAKNEITQPAIFAPRPKPSFKVPTLPGPTIAISSNSNGYPMRNYEPRMALKASASTPAEINGTVARPVISSAASLARPRPVVPEHGGLLMASKSLPESIGGDVRRGNKPHTGSSPPVGVGRAKLRELIAKYQG